MCKDLQSFSGIHMGMLGLQVFLKTYKDPQWYKKACNQKIIGDILRNSERLCTLIQHLSIDRPLSKITGSDKLHRKTR